jgi:hypothetical protein
MFLFLLLDSYRKEVSGYLRTWIDHSKTWRSLVFLHPDESFELCGLVVDSSGSSLNFSPVLVTVTMGSPQSAWLKHLNLTKSIAVFTLPPYLRLTSSSQQLARVYEIVYFTYTTFSDLPPIDKT